MPRTINPIIPGSREKGGEDSKSIRPKDLVYPALHTLPSYQIEYESAYVKQGNPSVGLVMLRLGRNRPRCPYP